jgi:hypothetical protein
VKGNASPEVTRGVLQRRGPWTVLSQRKSVRGKLLRVVLLTTALAVWVAGMAMLTQDFNVYRKSWAADLSTEADILALSTASALEFDDYQVAARNLAALEARQPVLVAAIYSANGKLYASYARAGHSPPPTVLPVKGLRMSGERVELTRPVQRGGERLGTIYLEARYDVWGRIGAYLGIFVLVTLLSLAVAFVFPGGCRRALPNRSTPWRESLVK